MNSEDISEGAERQRQTNGGLMNTEKLQVTPTNKSAVTKEQRA
jgi:hypothetical protein